MSGSNGSSYQKDSGAAYQPIDVNGGGTKDSAPAAAVLAGANAPVTRFVRNKLTLLSLY
jgi:hypothetical protein